MGTKNIYFIRKVVWVTLGNRGVENVNIGWGDADFVVYKGAYANLEFVVRDVDRKPQNLLGKDLCVSIIRNGTDELVLERELVVTDAYEGRAKLILAPHDMWYWEPDFYRYALRYIDTDAEDFTYLYNDFNQEVLGYIEIRDRAEARPPKPQEATSFQPSSLSDIETGSEWFSGAFRGPAQYGSKSNLVTVAFYMENFTGEIRAEASLDPQPDQASTNWFSIDLVPGVNPTPFEDRTGIEAFNIEGSYNWLRFVWRPENEDSGEVTKILLN